MSCVENCVHGRCYHLDCKSGKVPNKECIRPFVCSIYTQTIGLRTPEQPFEFDINFQRFRQEYTESPETKPEPQETPEPSPETTIPLQKLMDLIKPLGFDKQLRMLADQVIRSQYDDVIFVWHPDETTNGKTPDVWMSETNLRRFYELPANFYDDFTEIEYNVFGTNVPFKVWLETLNKITMQSSRNTNKTPEVEEIPNPAYVPDLMQFSDPPTFQQILKRVFL
jgi:hypothetical protein